MDSVQDGRRPGRLRRAGLALCLLVLLGGICGLTVSRLYDGTDTAHTAATPPQTPPTDAAGLSPDNAPASPPAERANGAAEPTPENPVTAEAQPLESTLAPTPLAAPFGLSWAPLVSRLAEDGFDPAATRELFASLGRPPLREFMGQKAVELYGRYGKAQLDVPEEETAAFAPPDYTRIAGGMTVAAGRKTINNNGKFFEGLYKQYGVPAPFIVAVMMVETGLGAEMGGQSALHALGSMSVTDSLDHVLPVVKGIDKGHAELNALLKARSDWAYNELMELIRYAEASGKDAATIPGSVYGAIGMCQFMPSNIDKYAVSTSKARRVPDVFVFSDAAASVARYLSAHGWKKAQTPAAQLSVLRAYNNSDVYASTVYGVASSLISPTTHRGAESARKGGNAVTAARQNARESIPSGSKKAKPIAPLPSYSDLLQ